MPFGHPVETAIDREDASEQPRVETNTVGAGAGTTKNMTYEKTRPSLTSEERLIVRCKAFDCYDGYIYLYLGYQVIYK